METRVQELVKYCATVLIVPCGMETTFLERQVDITDCINCTLRNGNVEEPAEEPAHNSINCTLRNGNLNRTRF